MRARLALILFLGISGASACKKEETPPPPDDLTLARILVNETGVSLGAEHLAPPLADKDALVRPLIDKLKARSKQFKRDHPSQTFVGRTEIELAPGTPCRAVMGVIGSAMVAGTSSFTLRSGAATLEVPAMPIRPATTPAPEAPRPIVLGFHADGSVDLNLATCLAPFDTGPSASLPALVNELCGEAGDCVRETHLGCDAKTPFDQVLPALAALRRSSKRMEIAGAPDCDEPRAALPPPGADSDAPKDAEFNALTLARGPKLGPPMKHARYVVRVGPVTGVDAPRLDAFTAAVRERLDDVKVCYELGLGSNPNLQGDVSVRLEINKKGNVMLARQEATKQDMPDPLVARCATVTLTNATFPASDARTGVTALIHFAPRP